MLKCSKCGMLLEAKDGTTVIGLSIKIKVDRETSQPVKNLLLDSLGEYCAYATGDKDGFEFEANFCYQCWLDSLFMGDRTGLIRQNAERGK